MIRLLVDENFNGRVLRAVQRECPDGDIVRVQDTALYSAPDPDVLAWAAEEGRIVLTQDSETMIGFAGDRLKAALPMPGLIVVRDSVPIGQVVADLLIILDASEPEEWDNLITFLPL